MPLPLFNKSLDIKLLNLVKENPILYNTSHSNYLNFDAREVVWQKIGDVLNRPAVTFAGIQCQIHFGDFNEEKHKPGYIENLNEFLPEQYTSTWGVEKKILKDFKTHQGLSQLEAKCLYIKTARDLPTYGVTFFLVKEKQKNKKKLVPRLLGINAESILRLDEVTKEILQVWPLTHVKTYHVGKSETFTLNFGDYSDKEYSVKTQDAYRIRDILEGYIDLIRKRLLAGREAVGSEGMVIGEENVEPSRGNIMHIVSNNPSKVVEQSYVGPSKLFPYANEMHSGQGAQVVTVQQMVVTGLPNNPQQALKGEVAMRNDMSMECVRRLNRLNSQSVTLVSLLSDPNEHNVREAQRTVDAINTDIMPVLMEGLNKSAQKQTSEEGKKRMLDEIKELEAYVKHLTDSMKGDVVKCEEAEDTSKKIANLTTQMYAALDPQTKRRSDIIRKSRKSFIADEKMDSSLRRASFIAAATTALHNVEDAQKTISQPYQGPALSKSEIEDIEKSAVDKIGKLNAAIALYLTAHTDPKIIDYSTAVNSMNTIKELMPELAKDAQVLGCVKDSRSRQQLLDGIRALCDSTKAICTLTGAEDHQKMQDASNKYADVSRKLIFTIGKGVDKKKEDEIIKLAKTAADKAVLLQKASNDFTGKSKTPEAQEINDASAHVVNCAKDLVACARMTGPSPHEAHCRSALLAASANTAAATRALQRCTAPHAADKLTARAADLGKALDAINQACEQLEDADAKAQPTSPEEMLRLQIVKTFASAKDNLQSAEEELKKPDICSLMKKSDADEMQKRLARKIAQMNAALASLVGAYSDRSTPDYDSAKLAVGTMSELLPEVVRDAKILSGSMDPASRDTLVSQLRALSQAAGDVCACADHGQGLNEAAVKFSNASGKLVFTLSPRQDNTKGQKVVDLTSAACDKASQLLTNVHQLADRVGGAHGDHLDKRGVAVVDRAQALLTAAQVTAPSMSEPRCQSSMLSSVDALASSSRQLAQAWRAVPTSPQHQTLENELRDLDRILDEIRNTCQSTPPGGDYGVKGVKQPVVSPHEVQRLKFVKTVSRAKKNLEAADDELNKADICQLMRQDDAEVMQQRLQQKIEELNAAVAALLSASSDRSKPDYATIEEALGTISNLLPEVAKDTKTLSSTMDTAGRDELLSKVRALCDASKDICASAESGKGLDTAASKFADASGKLVFTISPKPNVSKEQQVLELSASACTTASQLLSNVKLATEQMGGDDGMLLDRKGADVADKAQALLTSTQKCAPTITDAGSRSDLLSTVDNLSSSSQELASTWRTMPVGHHRQILEKELQQLEKVLGQLRGACQSAADDEDKKAVEVQRLKFVKSAAGARQNLQAADDELNNPAPTAPLKQEVVVNKQHQLHQNIAELNAAIAALLAATSDRSRPDYASAEKAVDTITNLLPEVAKDARSLSSSQGAGSEALLQHARALCGAARDVCAAAQDGQGLNESASKFADASGKLMFVVSPKPNVTKEQQVLDLTAAACATASQLLFNVHQAAQQMGGDKGVHLDKTGAVVADQAQALLLAAQEKAPTISEPSSQSSILSTVDALSSSSQELGDTWRQMPVGSRQQTLERELQELEKVLGQLRAACQSATEDVVKEKPSPGDIQRIKFVKTVAVARKNLDAADEELKKAAPPTPLSREEAASAQHQLQRSVAQMNGAVAALLTSTADRTKPDYATAEQAIGTVSFILPQVVKDAKALTVSQDPAGRAALLDRIHALCHASKEVCASAETGQGLNEAVSKYANASGKLVYVINPRVDVTKGQQVLDLSAVACGTASQLLSNVQQVSEQMGGDAGVALDRKGATVADNAQALLSAAQVTAPSISDAHCQASMLSAVDALSASSSQLAQAWRELPPGPQQQPLEREHQDLQKILDQIKAACRSAAEESVPSKPTAEVQRMKFIKSVSGAKKSLEVADKELSKPVTSAPLSPEDLCSTRQMLQHKIAQLNAAIGALVVSTADCSHPDYASAEQAVGKITDILPQVIQHAKSLSVSEERGSADELLLRVRALCDASRAVCHSVEDGQGLNEAAQKYADASGDLTHVVNPKIDPTREQKVLDLSAAACGTASQLLSNVQQVSEQIGGDAGEKLDRKGATVADHAQALLTTAQVTSSSISEPGCQSSLLGAVDALSGSSRDLANTWRQVARTPHHDAMEKEFEQLNQILYELRKPCEGNTYAGDMQQKRSSMQMKVRPEVPKRQQSIPASPPALPTSKVPPPPKPKPSRRGIADVTQDFLHRLRTEEDQAKLKSSALDQSTQRTDDERRHKQFVKVVDDAANTISIAEQELRQLCKSGAHPASGPKLNLNQQANKQKELQEKLALANVEVAALVGANYADKIDYNTASKSISSLPQLLTGIVEDGKTLSNSFSDNARKAFLDDMLNFCDKTRNLCDTAKNDRQKLKEAAIGFGDKSAKIMYTVSSEVDPQLEKQIISTAKEIGAGASRLGVLSGSLGGAGRGGTDPGHTRGTDPGHTWGTDPGHTWGTDPAHTRRAALAVDAAGALLYTAKLVSPSIHNTACKEALLASANKLSNHLNDFSDCWKPLASDPQHAKTVKELTEETNNLEQLLEHLRRSARGKQVVEKEKIVVEDTPLRVLACKILQDAQKMSEVSELSVSDRCQFAQYCDAIRNALTEVDEASVHTKRAPADINKHRDLENAIQNLQMVILQNRPKRDGKERSNIVDLRDYIQDLMSECNKMYETTNQIESPRGKKSLERMKECCSSMKSLGDRLLEPHTCSAADTTVDDILHIDQYGQICDGKISDIKSDISALQDEKASVLLQPRHQALVESCNVLRFATKSALSTAQSAALDETLNDLQDLDNNVLHSLMEDDDQVIRARHKGPAVPPKPWLKLRVSQAAQAVSRGDASAASAPAAYVTHALARAHTDDPEDKHKLQKHLSKLIHLFKLLTVVTSKRVATWQNLSHPEVATITDRILEELENPESGYGLSKSGPQSSMSTEDIKKLLNPNEQVNVTGDKKQIEEKVQKCGAKLSTLCGGMASGTHSSRTAHAATLAAVELAATARALKDHQDPIQSKNIEEAVQEMSYATYNVLATSEFVSQGPNNPGSKMKLLDALRQLNDSINKLGRASCPGDQVRQWCEEVSRGLQLQLAAQGPHSTCALPYSDCVNALNSQQEIIDKLKNEQPMAREEFMKNMNYITTAVCNSGQYATQCAYLISISDENKAVGKHGLVDTHKIQKALASIEDTCVSIVCTGHVDNMQEEKTKLLKQIEHLSEALKESDEKIQDDKLKRRLSECKAEVTKSADAVCRAIGQTGCQDKSIRKQTMELLSAVNKTASLVEEPSLMPQVTTIHPETQARCDEVINHSKSLITKTQALVKDVKSAPEDPEMMTWVMFKTNRDQVLDAFDALLKAIQVNGKRSGILEGSFDDVDEGSEVANKSYVQVQLETANKWLQRPTCKADTKMAGQQAVQNIVDIGKKMSEDMKPSEKEATQQLITEIEKLQTECSTRYEKEKYSLLLERLKDLKKIIERDLVTRVVEELIEEEEPLADLDLIADVEKDETKRQYLLEKKIAELLAQLGRMTKIAKFVADAGNGSPAVSDQLKKCTNQSELLAPMLVKAAQERISKPDDQAVVDHYKSLLSQYADSLSKVRDLCDQAVDPMEFVQTAGVVMERMREETEQQSDPRTCARKSSVITKLANRVISVSMCSSESRRDPELQRALSAARHRLRAVLPAPGERASKLSAWDWTNATKEILRTTGEVESVLGGENIFNKQPEPDQPIYSVALNLHASVREWSSRDNEIVGVARRMAVLMARLSDHMNSDKQRELLLTSKQIVSESHEVAYLAKKMAHECTDLRIKKNLLLACERIPTISAQLKMLTTVKGSSLGRQGTKEDKEAMNMLVDNAQSLMLSIQDVVKGAASASVKIMSQHGLRNRWVRRNYY